MTFRRLDHVLAGVLSELENGIAREDGAADERAPSPAQRRVASHAAKRVEEQLKGREATLAVPPRNTPDEGPAAADGNGGKRADPGEPASFRGGNVKPIGPKGVTGRFASPPTIGRDMATARNRALPQGSAVVISLAMWKMDHASSPSFSVTR